MLITTTALADRLIVEYLGIVSTEVVIGANFLKDFFAEISDTLGGRSTSYEAAFSEAKDIALKNIKAKAKNLGANALIGVLIDYHTVGGKGSMMLVTAQGTAVRYE